MSVFTEGKIRIEFPDELIVRKFDARGKHQLLDRGMKAVDCVVDLPDRLLFIEIKEPQDEKALENQSGRDLSRKFRDSFIYEWAEGRAGKRERPIVYIVLVGLDEVTPGALTRRTDQLRWWLPESGPSGKPWKRPLVAACMVMDLVNWNRHELTKKFPVARVS